MNRTPADILNDAWLRAESAGHRPIVTDSGIAGRIHYVCHCRTRAGARFLMACLVAKIENPTLDIRKPYTQIGGADTFAGRTYDEDYVQPFVRAHRFLVNRSTAFLTPALRNINYALTRDLKIEGRPAGLYVELLHLLDDVYQGRVEPEDLLTEIVRGLILLREETAQRLQTKLANLEIGHKTLPLSSEEIVKLIQDHMRQPRASRVPVLIVAAAYKAAQARLGEAIRPLQAHNAADEQTGSLGDVEVMILGADKVRTVYEMKDKAVTTNDIDTALDKIVGASERVDNYIIITTAPIDPDVQHYAASFYDSTGGTEIAVLDCIGFLRHFLHLFHRLREAFVDAYQALLLEEPESAVSLPLKEAFLVLRQAAQELHDLRVQDTEAAAPADSEGAN